VPGNLSLAALAHERHGRLPWATLFGPAIRLARDGFAITPRLRSSLELFHDIAALDPAARALFFDAAGTPLPVGTVVRNPAWQRSSNALPTMGPRRSIPAPMPSRSRAMSRPARSTSAPMTTADIASYHARALPPVCALSRVEDLLDGPPSAGASSCCRFWACSNAST
jgi:gamma-glutamyltranspeptidase/glutathione hydrolase